MSEVMGSLFNALNQVGAPIDVTAPIAAAPNTSGINVTSFMSGATSVAGGLTRMMAGRAEQSQFQFEASQMDAKADEARNNGQRRVIAHLDQLNADLSQIASAGGASGLDGAGSLDAAMRDAERVADFSINLTEIDADRIATAHRGNALALRAQGKNAVSAAKSDVFSGIASGLDRMFARG